MSYLRPKYDQTQSFRLYKKLLRLLHECSRYQYTDLRKLQYEPKDRNVKTVLRICFLFIKEPEHNKTPILIPFKKHNR